MTVYRMQVDAEIDGVSTIRKVAEKMNLCVEQTRPFTPGTHLGVDGHVEEEMYDEDWDPAMSEYSSVRGEDKAAQQEADEWAEFGLVKTERGANTSRTNGFLTSRKSKTVFNAADEGQLMVTLEWKAGSEEPLGVKVQKRVIPVDWVSAPAADNGLEFKVKVVDAGAGTVTITAPETADAVFRNPAGKPLGGTITSGSLRKGLDKRARDDKRTKAVSS
jgi:hypothetical protein